MAVSRNHHSDEEWLELIMQARTSGQSDAEWCRRNGIPASSFYNAVTRLRKKACAIPDPVSSEYRGEIMDLISASPDVVPIRIEPEHSPAAELTPVCEPPAPHLDNSHSIEILSGSTRIRVCNGTDPALLSAVLSALGRLPC